MAATGTPTPNIGLRIPQGTDPASVDDINYNSNLLDTKLGAVGNTSVQDQIDSLNSNIGNSKIINGKYYSSATTIETIQSDIDSAIAQYAETNKPKFMQFGYMNGTAGTSVGLYACFINIQFVGPSIVYVEFVKMDNSGTRNYMTKVNTWGNIG